MGPASLILSAVLASSPLMDVGMGVFVENRGELAHTGTLVHVRAGMPAGLTLGVSGGSGVHLFGPTFLGNVSVGYRFEPGRLTLRPYVATGGTFTLLGTVSEGFTGRVSQARAVGGFELMTESGIFGVGLEAGGLKTLKAVGDLQADVGPKRIAWGSWTPVVTTTLTWYIR